MIVWSMSRGHGRLQKKIIQYLKENPNSLPMDILRGVAEHKPYTSSEKSKTYRAIKRLRAEKVIIPGKMHNLFLIDKNYRRYIYPKPQALIINPEIISKEEQ